MAPLVFGKGDPHAKLVLIGEAPGEQEALQGRPFVGKAGKNLDEFLQILSLNRSSIYISNVVKFRPWAISKAGRRVNRPPKKTEIAFFLPYLYKEVLAVSPALVVSLGNVALQAFCPATIGEAHGKMLSLPPALGNTRLYPLYHPASVIYNPSLKEVYHQDLLHLREILEALPGGS